MITTEEFADDYERIDDELNVDPPYPPIAKIGGLTRNIMEANMVDTGATSRNTRGRPRKHPPTPDNEEDISKKGEISSDKREGDTSKAPHEPPNNENKLADEEEEVDIKGLQKMFKRQEEMIERLLEREAEKDRMIANLSGKLVNRGPAKVPPS